MQRKRYSPFITLLVILVTILTVSVSAEAVVKLNPSKKTVTKDASFDLEVSGIKKGTKVRWTSDKPDVASVSAKNTTAGKNGLAKVKVKAKKPGTARITAKVGKKTYTCAVTVKAKSPKPTTKPKKPTPTPKPKKPTPTPKPKKPTPTPVPDNTKKVKLTKDNFDTYFEHVLIPGFIYEDYGNVEHEEVFHGQDEEAVRQEIEAFVTEHRNDNWIRYYMDDEDYEFSFDTAEDGSVTGTLHYTLREKLAQPKITGVELHRCIVLKPKYLKSVNIQKSSISGIANLSYVTVAIKIDPQKLTYSETIAESKKKKKVKRLYFQFLDDLSFQSGKVTIGAGVTDDEEDAGDEDYDDRLEGYYYIRYPSDQKLAGCVADTKYELHVHPKNDAVYETNISQFAGFQLQSINGTLVFK